ncbi:MAG: hypothetical protein MUC63_02430, partial [Planctomycetes bacterium]|nr:hypothetical protein [Planctomycetota bacterium]
DRPGRSNGSYYYRVRGVNAGYSGAYATGANPCVVSLRGTITLALGSANAGGTELPGATGAFVIQFTLATDAVETATVTALTVTMSGTLALSSDATGAALVVDADGNGRRDAGETVLGTLSSLSGTTLAFTGLSRAIAPSSTERWLVTIDLASGAPVGSTFAGAVASNADVSATGSLSAAPFVAGAPVQGPTKTVQTLGSLAVMPGAGNPGASGAVTGSMAVAMLEIEVAAGAVEGVTLSSIAVQGDGSGNEASGVAGAFLYLDADGNDAFNPVLDTLVAGPLTFAADDGKVAFTLSRTIPANGSARFFVVYNFDDAASIGSQFRAGFSSNADASGTGMLSGKPVSVSGAPVWGGMVTVLSPPPVPGKEGGSCGGGPSPAGPGGALGLALLLLAGLAARRAALRR